MTETEVIKAVRNKKRTRPDRTDALTVHTEPGEMGTMMANMLALYQLPPIDSDDPRQVEQRITDYFNFCAERDMKPSVASMAMSLGVDRRTMWNWQVGNTHKTKEVRDIIKRAYNMLNAMIEEYMQNGKINPIAGIFFLKNHFGYDDKTEVVVTPKTPLGDPESRDEIEKKYLESVDDDNVIYSDDAADENV